MKIVCRQDRFQDVYHRRADSIPVAFPRHGELFRARTHLSISSYLIKAGLDLPTLWRLQVQAERALALYDS